MRVLIAEDDPINRRLVKHLLRQSEFEPITVDRGDLALETVLREGIQLVVLDWVMPGLTGPELCQRFRDAGRMVYAIILTGRNSDSDKAEALDSGASDFLTKPVRRIDLLSRLRVGQRILALQARLAEHSRQDAVGHLAAGMAHELNTPIQFIGDNLQFVQDGTRDLLALVRGFQELGAPQVTAERIEERLRSADVAYLADEIPRALGESFEGLTKMREIIRALHEFAGPGAPVTDAESTGVLEELDLKAVLDPVLRIVSTRTVPGLQLDISLPDDLPRARLHRRLLQDALLGMLSNSVDALASQGPEGGLPRIRLDARHVEDRLVVSLEDNGPGILGHHADHIFDPFYTTKAPGRGRGLGLHTARQVVESVHRGRLWLDRSFAPGARFVLEIPVGPAQEVPHDDAAA